MKFQEDITSWLKANCCCHTQKKKCSSISYYSNLLYLLLYLLLREYRKDNHQRLTVQDLTVLRFPQPLQNKQQSTIWDITAKNGSSHKPASASDFWQAAGANAFLTLSIFLLDGSQTYLFLLPARHCWPLFPVHGISVLPVNLMCLIDRACRMLISAVAFKASLTHFSGNLVRTPIYSQHMRQRCSCSPLTPETPAINQRKALSPDVERQGPKSLAGAGAGTQIPPCARTFPSKFTAVKGASGSMEWK